jgi:M penetrans paralogue family 26
MENQTDYLSQGPQRDLPNATAVLVLGILSIVGCFCYGLPGTIMGIIAMILASKDRRMYSNNPGLFSQGSYKNLNAGRICAIIGLSLSAIYILIIIFMIATVGFAALSNPEEFLNNIK